MKKDLNLIDWNYFKSPQECRSFLGREIGDNLEKLKNESVLLFVSGGSCLDVLPDIVNENFNNITIAVLDERFDQSNENNNFEQLNALPWSKNFLKNGGVFISTKTLKDDTQQKLADRFQAEISKWINENKDGKMIALFGMGSDGHTAGIFPERENVKWFHDLFDGNEIIASYDATGKNQFTRRITTTNILFEKLEIGFAYIIGQEKKKALLDFKSGAKKANELPVMLIRNVKNIKLVTDIE